MHWEPCLMMEGLAKIVNGIVIIQKLYGIWTNILLVFHILLLLQSSKSLWNKFGKYEKLVKYLSYCNHHRAIAGTKC